MSDLHLEPHDGVVQVLKALREVPDRGVRLFLAASSPILGNSLNLDLITQEAERMGKKIAFEAEDQRAADLLRDLTRTPTVPDSGPELEVNRRTPSWLVKIPGLVKAVFVRLRSKKFYLIAAVSGGVLLVGIALAVLLFILPRATITLVVDSDLLVRAVDLFASPSATLVIPEQRVIPAQVLSVDEFASRTAPATGRSTVGEKARGTVTVYNFRDSALEFPRGTRLESPNGLEFIFASPVSIGPQTIESVSSASDVGTKTTVYTAGEANVSVIAADVGSDYNLKAGTELLLPDFAEATSSASTLAKNREDLGGGFSREVKTVSETDLARLEEDLTTVLRGKAAIGLGDNLPSGYTIPEGVIEITPRSQEFDKSVGEEGENVTLSMRVDASAVAYSQSDFDEVISGVFSELIPDGFELHEGSREIDLVDAKRIGDDLQLTTKIRAFVVPRLEEEQLRRDLVGASLSSAKEYLTAVPNILSYKVNLWPPLPVLLQFLPKRPERIELKVDLDPSRKDDGNSGS